MTTQCRAKNKSTCPYHGAIYNTVDAQTIKEDADKLQLSASVYRHQLTGNELQRALARIEYMETVYQAQYDATDQGYAELDSEHARNSFIVESVRDDETQASKFDKAQDALEEIEERLAVVKILRRVREASQKRLDVARENLEDNRFESNLTRAEKLTRVGKEEIKNLKDLQIGAIRQNGEETYTLPIACMTAKFELSNFLKTIASPKK